MKMPPQIKPLMYGIAIGAIGLAIVGFSWGGWVSGTTASDIAKRKSDEAVIAVLTPLCVAAFKQDPKMAANRDTFNGLAPYSRYTFIAEGGWANMPDSGRPSNDLARSCADNLAT